MKDINGRAYATVAEVKKGTKLEVDEDFTCIDNKTVVVVKEDELGLFFECEEGHHYLDGQIDINTDSFYVGLYLSTD